MTTGTARFTPTSFAATEEDRAHLTAIAELLTQRGVQGGSRGGRPVTVSQVISYALSRVFLTECSTDGAPTTEQIAA